MLDPGPPEERGVLLRGAPHALADDPGGGLLENARGQGDVAFVRHGEAHLVPDVREVAGEVDDVGPEHLVVGERDQGARGLGGLDALVRPAGLEDRGGEEVDPGHVPEDLADGDAVADAVVGAEGVEEPAGEALDGRLERPGQRQPEQPDHKKCQADAENHT